MGCNICKNNDNFAEREFQYPLDHQNSNKDNIIITQSPDKIIEKKESISSPNLKELKENINNNSNNDKNKNGNEVKTKDDEENHNIYNNNNNFKEINEKNVLINNEVNKSNIKQNKEIENLSDESKLLSSSKNDYNSRVVDLINEIRTDPQKYAILVYNNMQYISKEIKIEANEETGQSKEIQEIFFQKKVKVKLYRGEKAFLEAGEYLRQMKPVKELINNDDIKLKMPESPEDLKNNSFIKNQLIEIRKKNNISAFFKDTVRNPEVAVLLMIVGDYKDSLNKKRNAILNPEYKYIAVNSKFIGDLFISYYTFSK